MSNPFLSREYLKPRKITKGRKVRKTKRVRRLPRGVPTSSLLPVVSFI